MYSQLQPHNKSAYFAAGQDLVGVNTSGVSGDPSMNGSGDLISCQRILMYFAVSLDLHFA